ncbi:MAG: DUF6732 family protein [Pseudomonadota bacterium]
MVRAATIFGLVLIATPAWAHVGHLGEVAGHGHWIAIGAGAAAIAIGAAVAKLRGAKKETPEDASGGELEVQGDEQEIEAGTQA